jgi:hypothetical protein
LCRVSIQPLKKEKPGFLKKPGFRETPMSNWCIPHEHISRRAFLKGTLVTAGGLALPNWGGLFNSQTIASETGRRQKHCILLWMNGGASQIDTFDLKPGRRTGGPFRPAATRVPGIDICEYLPRMGEIADKLGIIRSIRTQSPDHPDGIYHMHTCYKMSERVPHPELGAMIARYCGNPDADLPSFIRMGPTGNAGSGYLGPQYQPFGIGRDGRLPPFAASTLNPQVEDRRSDLLRFVEQGFAEQHQAEPFQSHRLAKERSWRLLRARSAFDISSDWPQARDRYGNTDFGRGCFLARKLVEAGVPFIEIGQDNYDSHADNFVCHKANMHVLDPAWSALIRDLDDRGLLQDTLVVWMGEVGRTPYINNRAGRDHYIRAWTIVLAGGGIRGGQYVGESDSKGAEPRTRPVTPADIHATIFTALGYDPHAITYHTADGRPTPVSEGQVIGELL